MEIRITDPDGNVFDTVTVPDEVDENAISDSCEKVFNGSLIPSFCRDFREAINSSPIFSEDPKYMAQHHLSCAVTTLSPSFHSSAIRVITMWFLACVLAGDLSVLEHSGALAFADM